MTLVNRWYQILQLLVTNSCLSLEQLSKSIQVSNQTVRRSIELLNDQIDGVAVVRETAQTYQLEILDFDALEEILDGRLKEESDFNSSGKRAAYILKRLIWEPDYVLIDDLSEELEVSRGTVNKDLKTVKQQVTEFGISLEGTPNRGLRLLGSEFDIRMLYIQLIYDYFPLEPLHHEVNRVIQRICETQSLEKKYTQLWKRIVSLTVARIRQGSSLSEAIVNYESAFSHTEVIDSLVYQIESSYHITLSQYDQDFLLFPLSINHVGSVSLRESFLRDVFHQMMKKIHDTLIVELNEEQIFQDMKYHLMFMMNRLIFRVSPEDLFYGEIEKKYPFAYELARTSIVVLEEYLNRRVSKAETSYLAIYFELALRDPKLHQPKEIAIVCTTGRGTAAIIRRQIEQVLGSEIAINQFSETDYEAQDLDRYFAVFTTIPLKNLQEGTPIIQLRNLFNDEWLRDEWQRVTHIQQMKLETVDFYFHQLSSQRSYQKNLQVVIEELEGFQVVDAQFRQRVFEREDKQSTIFSQGIAFPHTLNKGTSRIVCSIGTFDTPLETLEGEVELLFLIGIPETITPTNEEELLALYDSIFTIAADKSMRKKMKEITTTADFMLFMRRKERI